MKPTNAALSVCNQAIAVVSVVVGFSFFADCCMSWCGHRSACWADSEIARWIQQ